MAVANNLLLRRAEIALRRCTNIHCDCICDEAKQEILEYIVEPTNQLWEDIHGINIKGYITLWRAVLEVDGTFPRSGRFYEKDPVTDEYKMLREWERIPEPELVIRAIEQIQQETRHAKSAY